MIERDDSTHVKAATDLVREASSGTDEEIQNAALRLAAVLESIAARKAIFEKYGVSDIPLEEGVEIEPSTSALPTIPEGAELTPRVSPIEPEDQGSFQDRLNNLGAEEESARLRMLRRLADADSDTKELARSVLGSDEIRNTSKAAKIVQGTEEENEELRRVGLEVYRVRNRGRYGSVLWGLRQVPQIDEDVTNKNQNETSVEKMDKYTNLDRPIVVKSLSGEILLVPNMRPSGIGKSSVYIYTKIKEDWKPELFEGSKGKRIRVSIGNSTIMLSSRFDNQEFEGFSVEDYQPQVTKTIEEVGRGGLGPNEILPNSWGLAGLTSKTIVEFGFVKGEIRRSGPYVFLEIGGRSYDLPEGKVVTLGNDSRHKVTLNDDSVAADHAVIINTGDNILIRNNAITTPGTIVIPDTPSVVYNPLEHGDLPPLQGDAKRVFILIGQGLERKEIADRLQIPEPTVNSILQLRGDLGKILGRPRSVAEALIKILNANLIKLSDITLGFSDEEFQKLTPKDIEALEELDKDPLRSNQEIADALGWSIQKLNQRISDLSRKLGGKKRLGLLMDYKAYKKRIGR